MRSLSWKLAGALLLVVLVSVGLMAYLTNLSTGREFRQYVIQGNQMHAQVVGNGLQQYYAEQQSWNGVQSVLANLLRMSGDRIIVADSTGAIVGDTDNAVLGATVSKLGLEGYGTEITVDGREVGSYYYFSSGATGMMGGGMGGMMGGQPAPAGLGSAETRFLSRVNQSLWIAGIAAAAVAIILGLVITRQITRPVHALTQGARQISRGDFHHRVKTGSKDELGELVQSFNTMATDLEMSEQSRRRLTADIAHELRTPLTIVEGTVDGMLDGVFIADREHLLTIKEQTALLTRLINDLRDLSLAESGQLKLDLTREDIGELAGRKVQQIEASAREKDLQLRMTAAGNVPLVKIDRMRIEQVISNLLNNAIHHTPAGGSIQVSVVRSPVDSAGATQGVLISVADTGEGIAAEHLPHIFERFYRVSSSRARSEGGTGLGLAIVKHLVQAHGGRVWAESEPTKGSTFHVFLPA